MTKAEAKEYLDNYRKVYAELAPKRFLEALDVMLDEPSHPSNLDEVATKYAEGEYANKTPLSLSNRCRACYAPLKRAFEAGAEWLAGQGYIKEGIARPDDCEIWVNLTDTDIKDGDKVIVQIRKKEE